MKTQERAANFAYAAKVFGEGAADLVRARPKRAEAALSAEQVAALESLKTDGFAVLEGFWERDRALAMRDRLEGHLGGSDRDFDGDAYLRYQHHLAVDQGVSRIYHIDKLEPELAEFRFDRRILEIAGAYYGIPFYSSMMIFQHNTQSNSETRYYHVDAYEKEFKSFLYLDDVDDGRGPFAYLRGTHRSRGLRIRKQLLARGEGAVTSFHEDEVGGLGAEEVRLCGPAGTLLLADVRGLHRGTPQLNGSRSVLVNYITRHSSEIWPDK